MNNLKNIQEFSRTKKCFSRIKDITVLIANSRTVLGAQGSLATSRSSLFEEQICLEMPQ